VTFHTPERKPYDDRRDAYMRQQGYEVARFRTPAIIADPFDCARRALDLR